MSSNAVAQVLLFLLAVTVFAVPLGAYITRVFSGEATIAQRVFGPVERAMYKLAGVREDEEMPWQRYAAALLVFNLAGALLVYAIQRAQGALPLNPSQMGAVRPEVAFNTAVSFATNTNWQSYSGETTLSLLTQMLALTVQNFLSAATGVAVLLACIRGFSRKEAKGVGNFWVDLTRTTLYVLVPLSIVLALVLVGEGVVQTLSSSASAQWIDGAGAAQPIALGPVASQVAIKQLGTNGGGFFNGNGAHPFENPTALSSFVQSVAIVLIPAALCFTFGALVKDRRQGVAIFAAMMAVFVPLMFATVAFEHTGNPALGALVSGANMEGKEVRFGATQSAIWSVATTAASNGSVNAMHDSYTPMGGLVTMWLIQLGEIIFGGVGSGLYGMLVYAIIAVFIAGLMVGRTPEYLGKKIEAHEIKMAALVLLLPSSAVLLGTAIACVSPTAARAVSNPGAHGFSEMLYAFSSAANNNGSAFAGLDASGRFYCVALGLCMLIGRYWVIVPVLAIAGALAKKKLVPPSSGTLPTHTPLFVALLVVTVVLVGALTFLPSLALGPIVEHLSLSAR